MKSINVIHFLFTIFNSQNHYNKVFTTCNKIQCYGPITPKLAENIIDALHNVQEDGLKYTRESICGYVPVYLTLKSEYGDLESVMRVVEAMDQHLFNINTINKSQIGGNSCMIFLNGHQRYASKDSIFSLSDLPDITSKYHTKPTKPLPSQMKHMFRTKSSMPGLMMNTYYYQNSILNYEKARKYKMFDHRVK